MSFTLKLTGITMPTQPILPDRDHMLTMEQTWDEPPAWHDLADLFEDFLRGVGYVLPHGILAHEDTYDANDPDNTAA